MAIAGANRLSDRSPAAGCYALTGHIPPFLSTLDGLHGLAERMAMELVESDFGSNCSGRAGISTQTKKEWMANEELYRTRSQIALSPSEKKSAICDRGYFNNRLPTLSMS